MRVTCSRGGRAEQRTLAQNAKTWALLSSEPPGTQPFRLNVEDVSDQAFPVIRLNGGKFDG